MVLVFGSVQIPRGRSRCWNEPFDRHRSACWDYKFVVVCCLSPNTEIHLRVHTRYICILNIGFAMVSATTIAENNSFARTVPIHLIPITRT